MARTVKSPEIRRTEILDTAQVLFYTRGYEETAVRDIIKEIGIAKGTFYHHFHSKEELLDALIARLLDQSLVILEPILTNEQLTALEKLHTFFGQISNFKMENEALIRTLLPIWYQDSNAIMRDKMKRVSQEIMTPVFSQIVQEGLAEGVFHTDYPEDIGGIVLQSLYTMSEMLALMLLAGDKRPSWETICRKIDAYNAAVANMLGAAPGSIHLFEIEPFRFWFDDV